MLQGKNAVITGCNSGIGMAIMKNFAENGANLFVCIRNCDENFIININILKKKYNIEIIPIIIDLNDLEQINSAMKKILSYKKDIDILVNNAGNILENKLFHMIKIDEIKDLFNVNFFGPMAITQYISRNMIKNKKGSIINMTSIAAIDGNPGQLEYVSSKAALIGATKNLAIYLGKSHIRVNAIAPGIIETKMSKNIKEDLLNETLNKSIMKRKGTVEEIANVALFLASDLSSYITGQVLRVDGGL